MKAVIVSGALAQDHEFIYPYYRVMEAGFDLDVCIIGGKPVLGILGTTLPPNKNHKVKDINEIKPENYDLLILPGGVKSMEKIRQEKKLIKFISDFHKLPFDLSSWSRKVSRKGSQKGSRTRLPHKQRFPETFPDKQIH